MCFFFGCVVREIYYLFVFIVFFSLSVQTAFYLPTDTNRLVHIINTTTTKEVQLPSVCMCVCGQVGACVF